ncbi:unnamed protein product [Heterobilharzia americana]|nr:unnamed protein product [Heterobilharzia americana]
MSTGFYIGQTYKDKRNGVGTYYYGNGYYKYEGNWKDGKNAVSSVDLPKILGNGKFSMKDGSFYEGNFIDGEISGRGRRYYALSKNEYIGQFMLGERHGYGRMNYADGSIYEGDWSHNLQQGQGKYIGADGSKYTGGFIANKRNGAGCLWSHAVNSHLGSLMDRGHGKTVYHVEKQTTCGCQLKLRETVYSTLLLTWLNIEILQSRKKLTNLLHSQKMEISSDELKSKISVDICVYTESRQILIEESNRQLAVWVGKICKENLQSRIPVELQVQVETPFLSSMKEKGIYVMETPL